ncbi:MAG: PhoH family protein [Thermoanaerobaculia bacterium]|jgi:phosphate starvation-inducible PhoH-like protein
MASNDMRVTENGGISIALGEGSVTSTLFGIHDENLRLVEDAFGVRISARGSELFLRGDEPNSRAAGKVLSEMQALIERGYPVTRNEIITAVRVVSEDPEASLVEFFLDDRDRAASRRVATPRNLAQKQYLQAIEENDMTFALGPAGTGKTFLAVAVAASALNARTIKRIILCRPAVEAGEKLGFLPGDLAEKVNPYLRPLYDALYDLIGFEKVSKLLERNVIEIAPLAFMRGRTLSDAFIILDEAQNTTPEQMKMFLTRLGFGSKAVITGDVTQTDLPEGKKSGLQVAVEILGGVSGIQTFQFTDKDVVRHPLVGRIVTAYDTRDREDKAAKERRREEQNADRRN